MDARGHPTDLIVGLAFFPYAVFVLGHLRADQSDFVFTAYRCYCHAVLQCAASGRELASLSALLREANATIDASRGSTQATLAKHKEKLETARKVRDRFSTR